MGIGLHVNISCTGSRGGIFFSFSFLVSQRPILIYSTSYIAIWATPAKDACIITIELPGV